MTGAFFAAARQWSAAHPRFVGAVTRLERGGIPTAIFSSALFDIARQSLGLPQLREPGDIDLLVRRRDFGRAARVLGAVASTREMTFETAAGEPAWLYTREAVAQVGSDEVQFMDPQARLQVGGSFYNTAFTTHAVRARTVIETREGLLPLAHMADAVGMYGMLQRGGEKDDHGHAAVLMAAGGAMLHDEYTQVRAQVAGWDARVWNFVDQANANGAVIHQQPRVPVA